MISLALIIVLFIFTDAMTLIEDTDNWQGAFFILVLASVVVINICGAIFQGGLLGLAGKFPPQYIGGTLTGQGSQISSTFIRSKKSTNPRTI